VGLWPKIMGYLDWDEIRIMFLWLETHVHATYLVSLSFHKEEVFIDG